MDSNVKLEEIMQKSKESDMKIAYSFNIRVNYFCNTRSGIKLIVYFQK